MLPLRLRRLKFLLPVWASAHAPGYICSQLQDIRKKRKDLFLQKNAEDLGVESPLFQYLELK